MNKTDAVNHWDLPVTGFRPKEVGARVASCTHRDGLNETWEVRPTIVTVFDFYRGRVDRADAIRRYAS